MDHKISDYIKIYRSHISANTCEFIINRSKKYHFESHQWDKINIYENGNCSVSEIDTLSNLQINPLLRKAVDLYQDEIEILCKMRFKFDSIEKPRMNKYEIDHKMQNHVDHISSLFDGGKRGIPILSLVTLINDNFSGGDFILNNKDMKLKQGDVLIFPSIFLYQHEVTRVTHGTRYSLVSWAY